MRILDLTFVSENIANISLWKVLKKSTIGSDHYPIRCRIGIIVKKTEQENIDRWKIKDADWERFSYICSQRLINMDNLQDNDVEEYNAKVCNIIHATAT